jgi:diamine N-acetyltransferase
MKVNIVRVTLRDLKYIQKLNLALFKKEHNVYDSTFDLNWTMSERGKKYFTWAIKRNSACALVAKSEDKIVGYLIGGLVEKDPCRVLGKRAEVHSMMILKEFRNNNLGSKLVKEFMRWAKSKKVENVKVVASAGNKQAINFYHKQGFRDYTCTLELEL